MDEQLQAFSEHLAHLTTAPAGVWRHVALPVAVAINALNAAAGIDAPRAEATDAPVLLARQFDAALRRRRTLATAS